MARIRISEQVKYLVKEWDTIDGFRRPTELILGEDRSFSFSDHFGNQPLVLIIDNKLFRYERKIVEKDSVLLMGPRHGNVKKRYQILQVIMR